MKVIPVLDIMDGSVVQGYRGQRSGYVPISSTLTDSPNPVDTARSLLKITGGIDLYAADLDAIQRKGDNIEHLRDIIQATKATIWLDAGTGSLGPASAVLVSLPGSKVVIGSETLGSATDLRAISTYIPDDHRIFSLDILAGKVLTGDFSPLKGLGVRDSLSFLEDFGWSEVILLNMDNVGTGEGASLDLVAEAVSAFPDVSIYAGGGCRSPKDLEELAARGAAGVLVASALHRGWIRSEDLTEYR